MTDSVDKHFSEQSWDCGRDDKAFTLLVASPDAANSSRGQAKNELDDCSGVSMSKNARKRRAKQDAYMAAKPERQQRKKEKRIAKRLAAKAAIANGQRTLVKKTSNVERKPSQLRILIDCSFDNLMTDREIVSMCSQITRCYSDNRNAIHPCKLIVSGWNDKIAQRFRDVFHDQQRNWTGVKILETDYIQSSGSVVENASLDDLIYLSADASDVIETIDESKIYIIGGIVDKNRHKNLCSSKAQQQGIKTAQLPLSKYIEMASRKVLTVNHVFEIMSKWLEYRDWKKAFLEVIPKRKVPQPAVCDASMAL